MSSHFVWFVENGTWDAFSFVNLSALDYLQQTTNPNANLFLPRARTLLNASNASFL